MRQELKKVHQSELREIHRTIDKKLESEEFKKIWEDSYEAKHSHLYAREQREHFLGDLLVIDRVLGALSEEDKKDFIRNFDHWWSKSWKESFDIVVYPETKDEAMTYLASIVVKYIPIEHFYYNEKEVRKMYYEPIEKLAYEARVISQYKTFEERLKDTEFYSTMSIKEQTEFRAKHDREMAIRNFSKIFN